MKKVLFIFLISILTIDFTNACTTFVINGSTYLVYGRNYDFDLGSGFIVVNKSGLEKQAFVQLPNKPAKWISKYGSITFNQVGIDAPMGGMNEKGLVIAQMALSESKYSQHDNNKIINQLEWIQYQLDNSALLADVIENNKKIHIVPISIPVHYMVCDSLGNIGIIEFINGELIIHQGDDVTITVCSNMIYEQSKKTLVEYEEFGGQKVIPEKWNNIPDIIAIASSMINKYKKMNDNYPVDYSFDILAAVGSPTRTQWSLVFDIKNKRIHFKTFNNKDIRTIELNDFVSSCNNNIYILDIQSCNTDTPIKGQFINLTKDYYFNYKKNLISWYKTNINGFPDIPDEAINLEVDYAFNRRCK